MKTLLFFILIIGSFACKNTVLETTPQRKDLTEMVFASGILEADNRYSLTAQTDGYLTKLTFKEGDIVSKGQLLGFIDNSQNNIAARSSEELLEIAQRNTRSNAPAMQQIKASIAIAKAKLQQDQLQAERYKALYENNATAKIMYENAKLTAENSLQNLHSLQEQLDNQQLISKQQEISQRSARDANKVLKDNNLVKAIIEGKIYQKKKLLGDYVRKGDVIAIIASPNTLYAKLNVDENSMAKVKLGQEVAIQLNTNKGKIYRATIGEILPTFDISSQSFIIKTYFTDTLDFKIDGTQLEANIIVGEKKNALVIPRNYLQYGNKVTVKAKGTTPIKTGFISNDWVEILGGISANDILTIDIK